MSQPPLSAYYLMPRPSVIEGYVVSVVQLCTVRF